MKRCHQCQHENPDTANYCNNCGAKLKISVAERRQLTILFCDLVGSTALSEKLDPEEFRKVITDYHHLAEKVIEGLGGHIAQYLGDGLLVYFGYPKGLEDAPKAGVKAGLGILEAVTNANRLWEAAGKTPIKVRIGIHTGLVVVDDHLALGETVNIAARLEGVAPHNGLVISPQTFNLVQGWFAVESRGAHSLKGISEPMEVFRVLRETDAKTRLDIAKGRGLTPLVGRRQELEQIAGLWQRAKMGQGQIVLLNGEAGIGKSRLVDAVLDQVTQESEVLILEARCSAHHINSAFYPLIELLEKTILQFEPGDATAAKLIKLEDFVLQANMDFKSAMPLLVEFLSIPSEEFPSLVISPVARRQRTIQLLIQALLIGAPNQPKLFLLEDLHWSDASTREWLKLFLTQVAQHPILLLCTTRPVFKPEWEKTTDWTPITLDRLVAEDMAEICRHQTEGKALPKEVLEQIVEKTQGVPLFVEELTKMIMESGLLLEKPDGFELTRPLSALDIPSTLQDSLLARLDRLSNVKDVVQMGSVLGRAFSFQLLHAVLPREVDRLNQSVSELLEAEIFQYRSEGLHPVYQFKHALIQETAYESLLKSRRQQLHHRVANVLEHQFVDIAEAQPEIVAHHYTEAAQPLKAIPIWLKAGQLSSQKNASLETHAHLNKGIELLSHIKDKTQREVIELDFRLTQGGTFVVSHGFPHPKVRETFDRAREIAEKLPVNPKLGIVFMGLVSYYTNTEDYQTVDELLTIESELAKDPEFGYWFELFHCQKCFPAFGKGEFEQCRQYAERIIELADPSLPFPWPLTPGGYIEVFARAWLIVALQILGHTRRAKEISRQHLDFAEDYQDSGSLYHIHTFISLMALEAREWEKAELAIEEYLPIVREFGDPVFTLTAEVYYNIARAFQGDQKAKDAAIQLLNVCFSIGFKTFAVTLSSYVAELHCQDGEYEAALTWLEQFLNHANQTGSHNKTAEFLRIKALASKAIGADITVVEKLLTEALTMSRKQAAKTYELRAACELARLWQETGKTRAAVELLQKIYDGFEDDGDSVDLQAAKDQLVLLHSSNN